MAEDLVPTINLLLGSSYWWSLCHQAGWLPCMARTTSGELGKLKSNRKEHGVSNQYFLVTLRKDNENFLTGGYQNKNQRPPLQTKFARSTLSH